MTLDSEGDNTRNGEKRLPEQYARHLLPLSPQFDGSDERRHDPGQAPDVSEPYEALLWNSEVFGGVRIPLSRDLARFVERRLPEIRAGVRGRGKAELRDNGDLVVQFGVTEADIASSLVEHYVAALRAYLAIPDDHPFEIRVAETNLPETVKAATDRDLRAIGLRAITLSAPSNESTV